MAILIDTSVLVSLERSQWGLDDLIEQTAPGEDVFLASITASELLVGVHRAGTPERSAVRSAFVEEILLKVPVLSFDLEAARVHARIWADLARSGQLIPAHDLIIAAIAISQGCPVLTENVRQFERVPGLQVRRLAT